MTQQNTQAVVLQQPTDQKLIVKIEQDSDWISIGALFVSLLAFVVTIYVVKKSTKSQIVSNKNLIEAQNKLLFKTKKIEHLRDINEKFESSSIEFLYLTEQYSLFMYFLDVENSNLELGKEAILDSYEYDLNRQIKDKVKNIYDAYIKLRFNFRTVLDESSDEKELIKILTDVVNKAALLQTELIINRVNFKEINKEYKQTIAEAEAMLNYILKDNFKLCFME